MRVIICGLLLHAVPAEATAAECQCEQPMSLEDALSESSLVAIGRVSSIKPSAIRTGKLEVRVEILREIKRSNPELATSSATVYTPMSPEECGYPFRLEMDYLLYATGNPAYYKVLRCSKTEMLETARDDLDQLLKMKQ
ncbi:MAG: hypothetical protein KDD44_07085 [Bdellovibrionales bacterium]|nr:hypothetical protein [Bdellovibrionales bacterium]